MMDVEFYRAEAERCHRLAEGSKDPEAAARWLAMSRDNHARADELEAARRRSYGPSMQQQPVQQQQSKREPEDKK